MKFEGFVEAKTKFDIVKILKCHFRFFGMVGISFKKNEVLIKSPFMNQKDDTFFYNFDSYFFYGKL